jgi:hypothetical protein
MLVKTDASANRLRSRRKGALIPPLRRLQGNTGPHPPWDDSAPIRAELFSVERLEEHARSLAAAQGGMAGEQKGAPLTKRLAENEAELLAAYREIAEAVDAGALITPAAEWLIDNFHLIEKQIREIRADLPLGYYRQLPKLASGCVSLVDEVFKAGNRFAEMDFPTRNLYRTAVEQLARGSRFTELEVADAAVVAARRAHRADAEASDVRLADPGYYLIADLRRASRFFGRTDRHHSKKSLIR